MICYAGPLLAPTEDFCHRYILWANWKLAKKLQQWQWVETVGKSTGIQNYKGTRVQAYKSAWVKKNRRDFQFLDGSWWCCFLDHLFMGLFVVLYGSWCFMLIYWCVLVFLMVLYGSWWVLMVLVGAWWVLLVLDFSWMFLMVFDSFGWILIFWFMALNLSSSLK